MPEKVRTIRMKFDAEKKGSVLFKTSDTDAPFKSAYLERTSKEAEGTKKWEGTELLVTVQVVDSK